MFSYGSVFRFARSSSMPKSMPASRDQALRDSLLVRFTAASAARQQQHENGPEAKKPPNLGIHLNKIAASTPAFST